jgi:hypothetical protein
MAALGVGKKYAAPAPPSSPPSSPLHSSSLASPLNGIVVKAATESGSESGGPGDEIELAVELEDGKTVCMRVDQSKPMMDLLIEICAFVRVSPTDHCLQCFHPVTRCRIQSTANQTLHSLGVATIKLVNKKSVVRNKNRPVPQFTPFEMTHRVTINFPQGQKCVLRVRPDIPLLELFLTALEHKDLDPSRYRLSHPTRPGEPVLADLLDTPLSLYGVNEVCIVALQTADNSTVTGQSPAQHSETRISKPTVRPQTYRPVERGPQALIQTHKAIDNKQQATATLKQPITQGGKMPDADQRKDEEKHGVSESSSSAKVDKKAGLLARLTKKKSIKTDEKKVPPSQDRRPKSTPTSGHWLNSEVCLYDPSTSPTTSSPPGTDSPDTERIVDSVSSATNGNKENRSLNRSLSNGGSGVANDSTQKKRRAPQPPSTSKNGSEMSPSSDLSSPSTNDSDLTLSGQSKTSTKSNSSGFGETPSPSSPIKLDKQPRSTIGQRKAEPDADWIRMDEIDEEMLNEQSVPIGRYSVTSDDGAESRSKRAAPPPPPAYESTTAESAKSVSTPGSPKSSDVQDKIGDASTAHVAHDGACNARNRSDINRSSSAKLSFNEASVKSAAGHRIESHNNARNAGTDVTVHTRGNDVNVTKENVSSVPIGNISNSKINAAEHSPNTTVETNETEQAMSSICEVPNDVDAGNDSSAGSGATKTPQVYGSLREITRKRTSWNPVAHFTTPASENSSVALLSRSNLGSSETEKRRNTPLNSITEVPINEASSSSVENSVETERQNGSSSNLITHNSLPITTPTEFSSMTTSPVKNDGKSKEFIEKEPQLHLITSESSFFSSTSHGAATAIVSVMYKI